MTTIRWRSIAVPVFVFTCLSGFFAAVVTGCSRPPDPWGGTAKKRILASFAPLHCFAANVAEPDAEVRCLLTTTGPHEFQPSPQDARLLSTADVFIVNGLGLDTFTEGLIRSAGRRRLAVLRVGETLPKDRIIASKGHYHGDVFHAGSHDPHVWLGVEEAKLIVSAIRDKLIEIDKLHEEGYRKRSQDYLAKLDALKEKGKELKNLPGGLVTFHESFAYFGRSFGIPIAGSIRGIHGEEISAAELQKQVKEFREKGVRLIGVEPQYPAAVAEKLADAIGRDKVKTVPLDPIETGPSARNYYVDKEFYVQKMAENLENLKQAMK